MDDQRLGAVVYLKLLKVKVKNNDLDIFLTSLQIYKFCDSKKCLKNSHR